MDSSFPAQMGMGMEETVATVATEEASEATAEASEAMEEDSGATEADSEATEEEGEEEIYTLVRFPLAKSGSQLCLFAPC